KKDGERKTRATGQDQLVGRRVRKDRVRDLCGPLGLFQADRIRAVEAVLVIHFSQNWSNPGKKDRERKTRARLTTAKIMLPLVSQMRDSPIMVSRRNRKCARPMHLGPGCGHWTTSSKNAKLFTTANGQGTEEPSMVNTGR
ncbi:hypothetical protein M513_13385, partial [Trichuris suis]